MLLLDNNLAACVELVCPHRPDQSGHRRGPGLLAGRPRRGRREWQRTSRGRAGPLRSTVLYATGSVRFRHDFWNAGRRPRCLRLIRG